MLPAVAGIRFSTARARVDLPQPDSPTTPRVSPAWMSKEMPSTALRMRAGDQGQAPALILKCTLRSRTERMGGAASRMAGLLRREFRHSLHGPVAGPQHGRVMF